MYCIDENLNGGASSLVRVERAYEKLFPRRVQIASRVHYDCRRALRDVAVASGESLTETAVSIVHATTASGGLRGGSHRELKDGRPLCAVCFEVSVEQACRASYDHTAVAVGR